MEPELTEDEVDRFLLRNPTFVRSWLSMKGLGDLAEDLYFGTTFRKENSRPFIDYIENTLIQKKILEKNKIESLTENEMYKEILKLVNTELDASSLCHKVLQNLCVLLRCEKASLFMVRGTETTRYLISTLFDVTSDSTLEETLHTDENAIRIPFGKGILGFVAQNKCLLNIKDAYQDPRFLDYVDKKTGFLTKSVLCMPILDKHEKLLGVAQVMNKKCNFFDSEDENIFESFLSFCSISITNIHFFQSSFEEYKRHNLLLKLNQCILEYQNCLPKLMSEITKLAMEMLNCESISIYLIDPKKDIINPTETSKVFRLLKGASDISEEIIEPKVRKAIDQNINSQNTLDTFHSNDFLGHDFIHFKNEVESWLISLAIKDACKNFVGWIVYVRDSTDVFSQNDINTMEIFTMFCGLAIYNCRLYETAANMLSQLEFTNTVLSYYATCNSEIVDHFLSMEIQNASYYKIHRFEFSDFLFSEDDTILLGVRMFLDIKTLQTLNISKELLYTWLLTIKKNYRPVIYHNWRHAINVTQMMFSMLTTGKLEIRFTEFEQVCLLMACLCHDLDHRGHNNAFQLKMASPLATLYSTSVLEHHHIDRCIMILKNEDTNMFRNISADKYQHGLKLIEKAILATDLVIYFEKRNIFKRKIEVDDKTLESQESIELLISMMMTAADLSAITKPWEVQKKTAIMVAAEFFEQGDLESHLKYSVLPMMDRKKRHELPKMQVGFIDFVCTMVYKSLSEFQEELQPLYDGMLNNRTHWSNIANGDEEFIVDKEFRLVVNNISLESDVNIENKYRSQELLPSNEQVNTISTQTILTCDRMQKDIQTDISIPIDMCQQKTVAGRAKRYINVVETKVAGSQTTERKRTSVIIQTDKHSLRESEHLPILMPHEQPMITIQKSKDSFTGKDRKLLQKKSSSSYAQSTEKMLSNVRSRRASWIDEIAEEKHNELLRRNREGQGMFPEETTQIFQKLSRTFLPPSSSLRSRHTHLEREYTQNIITNEIINSDSTQTSAEKTSSKTLSPVNLELNQPSQTEKQKPIIENQNRANLDSRIDSQLIQDVINTSDYRKRKCMKIIPKTKNSGKGGFWKSKLCLIS